jgi:ribonuclease HI
MVLYFDGLCEPKNPGGVATYGYVLYNVDLKFREEFGVVGAGMFGDDVSNNVAEYTAMIRGMAYLLHTGYRGQLSVRGDSQLTIKQMRGEYKVRAHRLISLHAKAVKLKGDFEAVTFEWIPREENEEADLLSRKAFDEFLSKNYREYKEYYSRRAKKGNRIGDENGSSLRRDA